MMLVDIEDKLAKLLQEKLVEVPRDNITVEAKPEKPPAVNIANIKFEFENPGIAENWAQDKIGVEEKFDGDGIKTIFKLKEKPLRNSVRVECPPKSFLVEKGNYVVNYSTQSIEFRKAPAIGKSIILVKYHSRKSIMILKKLKVKALYSFEVIGENRFEADSLAEKVVKTLLSIEDKLMAEGIKIKPFEGIISMDEEEKRVKVQLKYSVETEIRVEQIVEPMEIIEISSKNI